MAKKSFKKEEVKTAEVTEESAVVAQEETQTTAISTLRTGEITGDIDRSDISFPRLNVVQGIGNLSEIFAKGDIVYNKEVLLYSQAENDNPLEVTVLSFKKYYMESIPYDPDIFPEIYNTRKEVIAAGLSPDWVGKIKPEVTKCADLMVVIKRPERADKLLFPFEYKGERYTLAMWTVSSTAYSKVATPVLSASSFSLRETLLAGQWSLASAMQKNKFTIAVPVFSLKGKHDADMINFLLEIGVV